MHFSLLKTHNTQFLYNGHGPTWFLLKRPTTKDETQDKFTEEFHIKKIIKHNQPKVIP